LVVDVEREDHVLKSSIGAIGEGRGIFESSDRDTGDRL
jgi:hypothetical protein